MWSLAGYCHLDAREASVKSWMKGRDSTKAGLSLGYWAATVNFLTKMRLVLKG